MATPAATQKVNIPGSTVYAVDANKDTMFVAPPCEKGQVPNQYDYYEKDGKPICPDSEIVFGALGNFGITHLMGKMAILKTFLNAADQAKNGKDEQTCEEALQTLATHSNAIELFAKGIC